MNARQRFVEAFLVHLANKAGGRTVMFKLSDLVNAVKNGFSPTSPSDDEETPLVDEIRLMLRPYYCDADRFISFADFCFIQVCDTNEYPRLAGGDPYITLFREGTGGIDRTMLRADALRFVKSRLDLTANASLESV